jgi:hypothetical protein
MASCSPIFVFYLSLAQVTPSDRKCLAQTHIPPMENDPSDGNGDGGICLRSARALAVKTLKLFRVSLGYPDSLSTIYSCIKVHIYNI